MSDMVQVEINPDVEAYPMLSIRTEARSQIEIPAAMLARLTEAEREVRRAELEIMRYVGEQYDVPMVHEWLADRDESDD